MSPPTTLLDRVRLRLRSRRAIEVERDDAVIAAWGWQRELERERAAHGRTRDRVADALGILTGPGIDIDVTSLVEVVRAVRARARGAESDRAVAVRLDDAIEDARRVLRTAGHELGDETAIGDDVARAIGAERDRRERAEQAVTRARGELRHYGHRSTDESSLWHDIDNALNRERVLRDRLHAAGRRAEGYAKRGADRLRQIGDVALLFAPCTCGMRDLDGRVRRDRVRYAPSTSAVDPRCPEHSPAWRYGGRPVRPLALPSGIQRPVGWPNDLGCDHQLVAVTPGGAVVHQARCRWLAGHNGLHGNATGRSWTGEPAQPVDDDVVDATILDALDRWEGDASSGGWVCDACGRPVNGEPCPEHQPLALADARAEAEPAPSVLVARCPVTPHDGGAERCSFVAGHPGLHSWSPELDMVPF